MGSNPTASSHHTSSPGHFPSHKKKRGPTKGAPLTESFDQTLIMPSLSGEGNSHSHASPTKTRRSIGDELALAKLRPDTAKPSLRLAHNLLICRCQTELSKLRALILDLLSLTHRVRPGYSQASGH